MALIICPECQKPVSDQAVACPNCGYPICANAASTQGKRTQPKRPKKRLFLLLTFALLAALAAVFVVLLTRECEHKWMDATCVSPQTCAKCDETEGEALGHVWQGATCVSPKTCATCNETAGDPADHRWQEATCKAPKTCVICGQTEGSALEHQWSDATCTTPKYCDLCHMASGSSLGGHVYYPETFAVYRDGWTVDSISSTSKRLVRNCTRCTSLYDSRPLSYDLGVSSEFVSDGAFIFTPQEFLNGIAEKYRSKAMILGITNPGDSATAVSFLPMNYPGYGPDASVDEMLQHSPCFNFYSYGPYPLNDSDFAASPCTRIVLVIRGQDAIPQFCNSLAIDTILACTPFDNNMAFAILNDLSNQLASSDTAMVSIKNLKFQAQQHDSTFILYITPM